MKQSEAVSDDLALVTGGGGHLGANLVRQLIDSGQPVRALLHSDSERPSVAGLPLQVMVGDLRDRSTAAAVVQGCRHVYHCAARVSTMPRRRAELFGCNVLGTRRLLQAAHTAGVERVVVTSSFSAVGHRSDGVPSDETEIGRAHV